MVNFSLIASMISTVGGICAIVFAYIIYKRNKTTDDKSQASEMTTVIIKLENIEKSTQRIESDVRDVKSTVEQHGEAIIRHDERIKGLEEWRKGLNL